MNVLLISSDFENTFGGAINFNELVVKFFFEHKIAKLTSAINVSAKIDEAFRILNLLVGNASVIARPIGANERSQREDNTDIQTNNTGRCNGSGKSGRSRRRNQDDLRTGERRKQGRRGGRCGGNLLKHPIFTDALNVRGGNRLECIDGPLIGKLTINRRGIFWRRWGNI